MSINHRELTASITRARGETRLLSRGDVDGQEVIHHVVAAPVDLTGTLLGAAAAATTKHRATGRRSDGGDTGCLGTDYYVPPRGREAAVLRSVRLSVCPVF